MDIATHRWRSGLVLALVCGFALVAGHAKAEAGGRLYQDRRLNVAFELPPGWSVRPCGAEAPNCLGIGPRSRRKGADPAVTVEVRDQRLDEALREHVLFERRGNDWVRQGRVGEGVASAITGAGWRGVEASASCGISDQETGFHAAAGTCRTAIISNGVRAAVIETDGLESTLDAAAIITKRFRFLP